MTSLIENLLNGAILQDQNERSDNGQIIRHSFTHSAPIVVDGSSINHELDPSGFGRC